MTIGNRPAAAIACGAATVSALAVSLCLCPTVVAGLLVGTVVSVIGTALALAGWEDGGLLSGERFSDLVPTFIGAVVVLAIFFLGDSIVAGINPLKPQNWNEIIGSSGPFGFLLTAGIAIAILFIFIASTIRLNLIKAFAGLSRNAH